MFDSIFTLNEWGSPNSYLSDSVYPGVVGCLETLLHVEVFGVVFARGQLGRKTVAGRVGHSQRFLKTLLKCSSNRHHLGVKDKITMQAGLEIEIFFSRLEIEIFFQGSKLRFFFRAQN